MIISGKFSIVNFDKIFDFFSSNGKGIASPAQGHPSDKTKKQITC